MAVDGVRTEDELFGDLRVGETLRDKADHFHLTRRQVVRVGEMRSCWWLQRDGRSRLNLAHRDGLLRGDTASLRPRARKSLFVQLRARSEEHTSELQSRFDL